jgi:hypothetical protein
MSWLAKEASEDLVTTSEFSPAMPRLQRQIQRCETVVLRKPMHKISIYDRSRIQNSPNHRDDCQHGSNSPRKHDFGCAFTTAAFQEQGERYFNIACGASQRLCEMRGSWMVIMRYVRGRYVVCWPFFTFKIYAFISSLKNALKQVSKQPYIHADSPLSTSNPRSMAGHLYSPHF